MSRFFKWLKRNADQNFVTYSRFGLPGEETDDRPPPTKIHIAPFNDESREFFFLGIHSQRAALISAGVGISLTVFAFLSAFFEFNWYSHRRGVDILALGGLLLFLAFGILLHYYVIAGIKKDQPRYLVPFIVVYTVMIACGALLAVFGVYHYIEISRRAMPSHPMSASMRMTYDDSDPNTAQSILFGALFFLVVLVMQSIMLLSVVKCRNYLAKKQIHALELRVAEKSCQQYPNMQIIIGSGDSASNNNNNNNNGAPAANGAVHLESGVPPAQNGSSSAGQPATITPSGGIDNPNHVPVIGVVNETIGTPPSVNERPPTRTIFTASDQ